MNAEAPVMSAFLLSKSIRSVVSLSAVFALAVVISGCQTPGRLVSETKSPVCPLCKNVTRTTSIKGLTYTRHVCPKCRTVRDVNTSAEAADLTEVHVCDQCKAAVELCPQCAAQR